MESWPLLRRQDCVDPVFPSRKNSFRFAKIERAQIGQLIVDLLQNRPDLLLLIGRELHLRPPAIGRIRKPAPRVAFRRISSLADPMTKNAPVTAPATKVARTRKAIFHRLTPFMSTNNKETPPKAIFFDAAGTLFHLPRGVGYHYALVGENIGLKLDSRQLDRAFNNAWNAMPRRESSRRSPRETTTKIWWRRLVRSVLNEVALSLNELDPAYKFFRDRLRTIISRPAVWAPLSRSSSRVWKNYLRDSNSRSFISNLM